MGFHPSHRASRFPGGTLCWSCGSFSSSRRAVGLRHPCPGAPSEAGRTIIDRVASGRSARWLPADADDAARRDREFTLDRARRIQAENKERVRLASLLRPRLRLRSKSTPLSTPSAEACRTIRLVRKTSPGDLVVLEPKRHRSALISHLDDLDDLVLEDALDVAALHLDADILNALAQEEVLDALNWPSDFAVQTGDEDDPFNNGVSLG